MQLWKVNFASAKESSARENPFTPKASLMRYWSKQINKKLPISPFILSKASPLNAVNSATFAKLAAQNDLLPTSPPSVPPPTSCASPTCHPILTVRHMSMTKLQLCHLSQPELY
ncbi:hypothetical protein GH714_023178 [Hevea brasiliensis]|uniref:Uncharacterized protein n=1 Tax=Hevea brasiliensis TaxID=3981 RepID=A0A6A6KEZ4_HEVBR|nr:hypothetical protein GH714_023178 [Hevea brasiliensis]